MERRARAGAIFLNPIHVILCETFRGFFKFLEEKWSLFEKFVEDSREMTKARENWSAAQRAAKEAEEAKSRGGADEERIIVVQGWTRRRSSIARAAMPCS